MISKEFAEKRLDQVYNQIQLLQNREYDIRKWCITVWLACIALSTSDKFQLEFIKKLILPIIPILFFWILEAFSRTSRELHGIKGIEIEKMIAENNYELMRPIETFLLSGYTLIQYKSKVRYFFISFFLREYVFVFYLTLIAVTLVYGLLL